MKTLKEEMLEAFLATISQDAPLVQMGEDYELVLKSKGLANER